MVAANRTLALVCLALLAGLGCPPSSARAQDAPPTVAIADLDNHTGDPGMDAAGAGVASVLISKFSKVGAIQVVERARLQELLAEMELAQAGVVDPSTAAEAGRMLGADYMVLGSLFSVKLPSISVSLRVVDVESGAVVASEEVTGSIGEGGEEFFVLVDELSYLILDGLQVRLASRDRIEFSQIEVRQLETVQVFGEALRALDRDEADAAQDYLARAVALEPGFTLAEETLDRLAAEVAGRRTAYAHRAIEEVHGCWDQVQEAVRTGAEDPHATPESLAAQGLQARLHLIRGEFDAYFAVEERRLELTEELLAGVDLKETHPDHEMTGAWRDTVKATGFKEQASRTFREPAFYPYEIRNQMAEVMGILGRTDEALALTIETYQHRGPRRNHFDDPVHPASFAERWGLWDTVVIFEQQRLRQRELAGDEEGAHKVLDSLDEALEEVRDLRELRKECTEVYGRLATEPISPDLVELEEDCLDEFKELPGRTLAGYQAFLRRVEAGYYAPGVDDSDYRSLASGWRTRADSLLNDAWYVERRLQHLLTYQEQAAPRDDEEAERYRERLESFIEGAYKR